MAHLENPFTYQPLQSTFGEFLVRGYGVCKAYSGTAKTENTQRKCDGLRRKSHRPGEGTAGRTRRCCSRCDPGPPRRGTQRGSTGATGPKARATFDIRIRSKFGFVENRPFFYLVDGSSQGVLREGGTSLRRPVCSTASPPLCSLCVTAKTRRRPKQEPQEDAGEEVEVHLREGRDRRGGSFGSAAHDTEH